MHPTDLVPHLVPTSSPGCSTDDLVPSSPSLDEDEVDEHKTRPTSSRQPQPVPLRPHPVPEPITHHRKENPMTTQNIHERIAASGAAGGIHRGDDILGHLLDPAYEVIVEEVPDPAWEALVGKRVWLLEVDPDDPCKTFLVGYSSSTVLGKGLWNVTPSSHRLRHVPEAARARIDRLVWVHAVRRLDAEPEPESEPQAINIVFDGPPSHESGRFVEVETDDGRSIKAGKWVERPDGLWALRITRLPNLEPSETANTDPGPAPESGPEPSPAPAAARPQVGQRIRITYTYKPFRARVWGQVVYEGTVIKDFAETGSFVKLEGGLGLVQYEGEDEHFRATWEPLGWPENCVVYADYRSLDGCRPDAKDLLLIRRSEGWYSLSGPVRDDLPDVDEGVEFEISNIRMVHDGQVPS